MRRCFFFEVELNLKTTVVFVDLSAAYDTVWRHGLLLKLSEAIPCIKMVSLIDNMLSNRFFQVYINGISSRWQRLMNGHPQGRMPSSTLFSLYVADLPATTALKFQFADNIACVA